MRCMPWSQCQERLPSEINISKPLVCVAFMQPCLMPNLMKLHLLHLWATENDIIVWVNCFAFYLPPCVWHVQLHVHPCECLNRCNVFSSCLKVTAAEIAHRWSVWSECEPPWKAVWSHSMLFMASTRSFGATWETTGFEFISAFTTSTTGMKAGVVIQDVTILQPNLSSNGAVSTCKRFWRVRRCCQLERIPQHTNYSLVIYIVKCTCSCGKLNGGARQQRACSVVLRFRHRHTLCNLESQIPRSSLLCIKCMSAEWAC